MAIEKKSVQERIDEYKRRLAELEDDARSWQKQWEDIQTYVLPGVGKLQGHGERANDGGEVGQLIINAAATQACKELAAGLANHLSNPEKDWFKLTLRQRKLLDLPMVRPWLEECTRTIADALKKSNFYEVLLGTYEELGGFGTGCLIIDTEPADPLIFKPMTIGEYYLGLDHNGRPDTLYRRISMTVVQLVRQFGLENVSTGARAAYNGQAWTHRVIVVHVLQPRETRKLEQGNPLEMAWESVYFEESESDKRLREGGYTTHTFAAATWHKNSTDTYGRSSFMTHIGDCKGIQWYEQQKCKGIDLLSEPPMNVPSSLKNRGGASLAPRAQNVIDGPAAEALKPTMQVQYPIDLVSAEIENIIKRVRDYSFANLFVILRNVEREMTAYEARQRVIEGMTLLGPVVQRLQAFHSRIITRSFDILWERGDLPEPPPAIAGMEYSIEFKGFLAQAQKAADAGVIDQWLTYLGSMAKIQATATGQYPDILDKADLDETADELADMLGVPARMVRDDQAVQLIRMQRMAEQQQQAAMASMQAMEPMARAAKAASETKVGGGRTTLLDKMTGGT